MKNPPIIIIGAGRSGTNILRDSICSLKGFETWPCDEINYIWRHGNITKSTDRFTAKDCTPKIKKFIQQSFEKFEQNSSAEYVVEKTCANSLRVPFIESIFPNALYIFLIRDGLDVATSAKKRWTASLELKYILKKAKYVPFRDLPYYGFRYFINRINKVLSKEKKLAFWGPIYPNMMKDLKEKTLLEVCAKQWKECVERAAIDLDNVPDNRVYKMKYETFVTNPKIEVEKLLDFIGYKASDMEIANSVLSVNPKSIANYKKSISKVEIQNLLKIIEPSLVEV